LRPRNPRSIAAKGQGEMPVSNRQIYEEVDGPLKNSLYVLYLGKWGPIAK
jgi:hypothetical protein